MNYHIVNTAAEAPWKNGKIKNHNAIMTNMVTPNHLDFGKNLNFPFVIYDKILILMTH